MRGIRELPRQGFIPPWKLGRGEVGSELQADLQVDSTSCQEIGHRIVPAVHVLDPIVVDRVVDAQEIEHLEGDQPTLFTVLAEHDP